jgi:hypothetical protein
MGEVIFRQVILENHQEFLQNDQEILKNHWEILPKSSRVFIRE